MNKYLNHIVFKKISHLTNYLKIESFVVGGFVRDCLINEKAKFQDIDIVCNKDAITLANLLAKELKIKDVTIFKNFGTAMIKYENIHIEFINARKEYYEQNSRKPKIKYGSLIDDPK